MALIQLCPAPFTRPTPDTTTMIADLAWLFTAAGIVNGTVKDVADEPTRREQGRKRGKSSVATYGTCKQQLGSASVHFDKPAPGSTSVLFSTIFKCPFTYSPSPPSPT